MRKHVLFFIQYTQLGRLRKSGTWFKH